ncbi:hypothetical protein L9F63_007144, partial [Diploptera punctata]
RGLYSGLSGALVPCLVQISSYRSWQACSYALVEAELTRKRESSLRQHSFFQLRVHLKRGVDLVARDKGVRTSDPYVKFKVGGRLLYKSKTIYRELNPVWDETFTLPIEDPFMPVHIKVFDYDWGLQDDFMGSAYLDLTKFELGKAAEITLTLRDPGKRIKIRMTQKRTVLTEEKLDEIRASFERISTKSIPKLAQQVINEELSDTSGLIGHTEDVFLPKESKGVY